MREPFPRSDTLGGALTASVAELGEDVSAFASRPPFAVSSLFPFWQPPGDLPLYFWPRPLGARQDEAVPAPARAAWHRVRYLSSDVFAWALGGPEPTGEHHAQEGEVVAGRPLPTRLWSIRARSTRGIDRASGQAWGVARRRLQTWMEPEAGLFFVARYRDRAARSQLERALRVLADTGLGREAPFTFEIEENFAIPSGGTGSWVLLSLYHPTPEEVEQGVLRGGRYELVQREGRGGIGDLRPAVRMVGEGSRVPDRGGPPAGAVILVEAPGERPFLRSGTVVCAAGARLPS